MTSAPPRRSSLGMLLRRTRSGDLKKQSTLKQLELQREREAIPISPPRLPVLYGGAPAPQFNPISQTFRPDSITIISGQAYNTPSSPTMSPRPSMSPYRESIDLGRPSMQYQAYSPPPPSEPQYSRLGDRSESMTNRGRYSYASSAISMNSPRRVRRRKDPTPFNILIVGSQGSGKTSFLEFLKKAFALSPKKRAKSTIDVNEAAPRAPPSDAFIPHYLETEIDNERMGLTLWDSEGLERNVVDLQLREMATFVESKFEETFAEEMKVIRSPGVQDTHIHAVFLILDPARLDRNIATARAVPGGNGHSISKYGTTSRLIGGLDEDLDLQVLRTLQGKTTVIPVISKADTITTKHMEVLKSSVWNSLKAANLDPMKALGLDSLDDENCDDDEGDGEEVDHIHSRSGTNTPAIGSGDPDLRSDASGDRPRAPSAALRRISLADPTNSESDVPLFPMSIISPDIYEPGVIGRQFPWGFADPYNEQHCDFVNLKDAVFSEWRSDLREASREQWYEGWRTSRLRQRDIPHTHAR